MGDIKKRIKSKSQPTKKLHQSNSKLSNFILHWIIKLHKFFFLNFVYTNLIFAYFAVTTIWFEAPTILNAQIKYKFQKWKKLKNIARKMDSDLVKLLITLYLQMFCVWGENALLLISCGSYIKSPIFLGLIVRFLQGVTKMCNVQQL